ncbi:MAG: efflux RND transporter periplasmic adaptor subunit [Acidobacteria bacterium]|nr:efflux RND transporter periplasmic adaptor subunit [Acidobacteriota bacterium]
MTRRWVWLILGGFALLGLGVLAGLRLAGRPATPLAGAAERDHPDENGAEHADHDHEKDDRELELDEATIRRYGIAVATVEEGSDPVALDLVGEVRMNADRIAQIVPRVSGVVREVRKNLGQTVRRGEVVAVLESRELADLFAGYRAARQRAEKARESVQREEQLQAKRISARQDLIDARNALTEAQIELQAARQRLQALGYPDGEIERLTAAEDAPVTRYEMTAPFDATVIEKTVNPGSVLRDDTPAFRVADLGTVWVDLDVHQKDLPSVHVGREVILSGGPGAPAVTARIAYIEPTVVEQTRTVHARAVIPNAGGRWRPGLFVTARMVLAEKAGPVRLPVDAVLLVDGAPSVFVRTEKGFRPQPVKLGRVIDGKQEILDGLRPGQRYAARGAFTLKSELNKPESECAGHHHD